MKTFMSIVSVYFDFISGILLLYLIFPQGNIIFSAKL